MSSGFSPPSTAFRRPSKRRSISPKKGNRNRLPSNQQSNPFATPITVDTSRGRPITKGSVRNLPQGPPNPELLSPTKRKLSYDQQYSDQTANTPRLNDNSDDELSTPTMDKGKAPAGNNSSGQHNQHQPASQDLLSNMFDQIKQMNEQMLKSMNERLQQNEDNTNRLREEMSRQSATPGLSRPPPPCRYSRTIRIIVRTSRRQWQQQQQ